MNRDAVTIFNAALGAVDPYAAVKEHVDRIRTICREEGLTKIYVVALGKAAYPMTRALVDALRDRIAGGVVVTKYGHAPDGPFSDNITIYEAGHPVPDGNGVAGTIKAVELHKKVGPRLGKGKIAFQKACREAQRVLLHEFERGRDDAGRNDRIDVVDGVLKAAVRYEQVHDVGRGRDQAQLERIAAAKTDEERQKAMAEHMQTMQENMKMASGMRAGMMDCPMMEGGMMGKGGMGMMGGNSPDAMAKHMERMEKRMDMMQMMMEQMTKSASTPMPAK